jgi:(1->4)-alpha-D-glucan 1-alpha-D-glucosylmutase
VGGAPDRDGLTVSEFHDYCQTMQASHPLTMTTLSTHDTKRSDDVRARLAVITEAPGEWKRFLRRWSRQNTPVKTNAFPDRNTEYFLYQTLLGAWPIEQDRFHAYMEKAVREAKQQTSWTQQNKEFEDALHSFIDRLYETPEFITSVEEFVHLIITPGRVNSLAQTLLKCIAPGVPDTYQGSELWSLHLVDPDNRQPVDYETRIAMLSELESGLPAEEILQRMDSGLPKFWTLHQALNLRHDCPECFGPAADYTPLMITGRRQDHVIAFLRAGRIAAIVPRWNLKLAGNLAGTSIHLPNGRWKNLLTQDLLNGGPVPMQTVLQRFPVALLQLEEASPDASL